MLRKLKLVNWRNYSLVEIDLEKMNVFIGKNGSGKTNIKAAIEFLFTGKCEYTLAGEKVEELIKDGQGQAIVEGVLDDGTIVRRTVPGDLKVQGWSGNTTTLQKLLMDKLNTTEAVITAVLNTNNFINLKDDQKKNMIFALLGLVFDKAKILQEFQKWSGQRFNDTVLELFNKDVPDTISGGAEVFDKIYKTFYANRTGVNRTKKELETLSEKQQMPDIPEGINMDDKPAVEELLKDLRKERDSILQSKTTDERAKKQLQEAINRKEAYVNAATKIREELKKVTEGRANIADINKQITELEKKIVTKQDEANEVNRKIHESVGSVNSTHTTLQSLKSRKDNSCPVAPGTITCPMGDDEFAKIIDKIEKTYERDNAKLLTFREKGAKLAEELVPMKEEMRSLRSKLEAVDTTTKKENHLLLEAAKQDALAESENLIIDNANLGAEVNYDEKVALFDERILKGEGILSKMNSYDESLKVVKHTATRLKQVQAESEAVELLVDAFGPKGIKTELIRGLIGPLQDRANKRMMELTGNRFSVMFGLEDDKLVVRVQKDGGMFKEVGRYSRAERSRAGVAIIDVLNSLTGLGLAIIDDADQFDNEGKQALQTWGMTTQDYSTVIMLAVLGEKEPKDPGQPGLAVFAVEDGDAWRATA